MNAPTQDTPTVEAPPSHLTLSTGVQVFMPYNLLNALAVLVGNIENVTIIYVDMDTQLAALKLALGGYNKETKSFVPAEDTSELSLEDAEKLTHWIVEHLLDFFVRTLRRAKTLEGRYQPVIASLTPSSTGSKD